MSAENPGNAKLKYKKFYQVRRLACKTVKEQMAYDMCTQFIGNVLMRGDTQPAVVRSAAPLVISAYSDEMDAVIFLKYPDELAATYSLKPGDRLVTSVTYVPIQGNVAPDIFPGSGFSGLYGNVIPLVQLFFGGKKQILFAGGDEEIRNRISIFPEELWERVEKLTEEYASRGMCRDGLFFVG